LRSKGLFDIVKPEHEASELCVQRFQCRARRDGWFVHSLKDFWAGTSAASDAAASLKQQGSGVLRRPAAHSGLSDRANCRRVTSAVPAANPIVGVSFNAIFFTLLNSQCRAVHENHVVRNSMTCGWTTLCCAKR
jgi:hypothetical protein